MSRAHLVASQRAIVLALSSWLRRPGMVLLLLLTFTVSLHSLAIAGAPAQDYGGSSLSPIGHLVRLFGGYLALAFAYAFGFFLTLIFAVISQGLSVDDTYFGEEFPDQVARIFNALGS